MFLQKKDFTYNIMKNKPSEYQIAELIYKSIAKIISLEEKEILDNWLSSKHNKDLYSKIIDKNTIQNKISIYNQIETERIYKELEAKISKRKRKFKVHTLVNVFKYASIAILFLGIGYLYQSDYFTNKPTLIVPNKNITLQLGNGVIEVISELNSLNVHDAEGNIVGTQNGAKLVYNNDVAKKEILDYNTLTVPYGKRFEILLSDGSTVHLNAGTSLKYPVKFIEGKNREVFLKGEAYFIVAKDVKHPFIVNSGDLNVQVLGTQFNFSSYPEDNEKDVVLVEGSVNLFTTNNINNNVLLKPGFKANYNEKNAKIATSAVITSVYASWIDGELVFRNVTFDNILKKMERHYNVSIVNNNSKLANEKFNASFRKEPIEKILEYFKITYDINYKITDTEIIIY